MQPLGIHHVNVEVRDLEPALVFYRDHLAMPVLPRPVFDIPGHWLGCGSQQVHLVQTEDGRPNKVQHFAILIRDRANLAKKLLSVGISVEEDEGDMLFVYDPSGNRVELVQSK